MMEQVGPEELGLSVDGHGGGKFANHQPVTSVIQLMLTSFPKALRTFVLMKYECEPLTAAAVGAH